MARTKKAKAETEEIAAETVEEVKEETEKVETSEPIETPVEKTEEPKEAKKEYTDAEIKALIAAAVAEAMANNAPAKTETPASDGVVTLLFVGGIAPGTVVALEGLGKIPRDGNFLTVPKKDFFTNLSASTDRLLQKRKLIVVDGLTDDERERYGVLYKEGELLSADMYQKLLTFPADKLGAIYRGLCAEHREIVRRVFNTAYLDKNGNVSIAKLKAMIRIDRENGIKESPLVTILRTMTEDVDVEE